MSITVAASEGNERILTTLSRNLQFEWEKVQGIVTVVQGRGGLERGRGGDSETRWGERALWESWRRGESLPGFIMGAHVG